MGVYDVLDRVIIEPFLDQLGDDPEQSLAAVALRGVPYFLLQLWGKRLHALQCVQVFWSTVDGGKMRRMHRFQTCFLSARLTGTLNGTSRLLVTGSK